MWSNCVDRDQRVTATPNRQPTVSLSTVFFVYTFSRDANRSRLSNRNLNPKPETLTRRP